MSFSESCQFTKYKLNQYYEGAFDGWDKPYKDKSLTENGKVASL